MTRSEHDLVEALQHGDQSACDDLMEQYSREIYNVALRLTGRPEEAEDILQETFIRACQAAEDFEGKASLSTWLYRIAKNSGLMRLRRQKFDTVSLESSIEASEGALLPQQLHDWTLNPESALMDAELFKMLDDAVAELSDSLRAAFVLRDIEGRSTAEAAEALDISESALKVRLHRARKEIRDRLTQYFTQPASVSDEIDHP